MTEARMFEDILDECLDSLLIRGGTVEDCLRAYPESAAELRPLLETFISGRAAVDILPSQQFRDRARNELYAALQERGLKKSWSLPHWLKQPSWATAVVAIALAVVLAGGGTAAAASGSMPDEVLYPVKRAAEAVQLTFTFTSLSKAKLHSRLADRRVEEIAYLAESNQPERMDNPTENLDRHLNAIASLTAGQPTAITAMAPQAAESLQKAMDVPPEAAEEQAEAPMAAMAETAEAPAEEAATAEPPPPAVLSARTAEAPVETPGPADPRAELQQSLFEKAAANTARLRALLDKAPPAARAGLLKAIEVSETGYSRAIDALQ